jgi:hypothetical protein
VLAAEDIRSLSSPPVYLRMNGDTFLHNNCFSDIGMAILSSQYSFRHRIIPLLSIRGASKSISQIEEHTVIIVVKGQE